MKDERHNKKKNITKLLEEMALKVTTGMGIELVDVEYFPAGNRSRVVVYIDKPGGVFIEDCEEVNKALGEILDREDPIPSSYLLEVSSPGVERPLKKPEDYKRFKGNYVKIKTFNKINDRKNFAGILKDFEKNLVVIEIDTGEHYTIPLQEIAKANLWYKDS